LIINASCHRRDYGHRHRDYGHYSCRAISMTSASAILKAVTSKIFGLIFRASCSY